MAGDVTHDSDEAEGRATVPSGDELPPLPSALLAVPKLHVKGGDSLPRIHGYEILGVLGRGGMGIVYRAKQLSLNRVVALKLLRSGIGAGREEVERFRLEAESAARLAHPHIVQVFDVGQHEGQLFCVLEYLEGGTLAEKQKGKPLPPREAAQLALELTQAVHAAHGRGILHRDLKPANVMLTAEGRPKITDFGLAKMLDDESGPTLSGAILGTPCYMAPEQAQGRTKEISRATDLYSVGAILYEMLTGRPPFCAGSALEVLRQVISDTPPSPRTLRPEVPAELERICLKCLSKDASKRYADGAELASDLQAFLRSQADGSGAAGQNEGARSSLVWAIAGIAVALVLAAIFLPPRLFPPTLPIAKPPDSSPGDPMPPLVKPSNDPKKPTPPDPAPLDPMPPTVGVNNDPPESPWQVFASFNAKQRFDRVAFPTRTVGYLAGAGTIYRTEDGGKEWKPLPSEKRGKCLALHFTDEKTGWFGGEQLLHTADGGQTWSPVLLPEPKLATVHSLAIGSAGLSLVGGANAAGELALCVQPAAGESWKHVDPVASGLWGGAEAPHRNWYCRDLAVVSAKEAFAVLLQIADPGGGVLLRTEDAGQSWTAVLTSEENLFDVAIAGQRGWLVGGEGAMWESTDGGRQWRPRVTPLTGAVSAGSLAVSPGGEFGLAALRDGSVMVLLSDGRWETRVDAGLGGMLKNVAVVDGQTGFVLGSDGRVARYENKKTSGRVSQPP